MGEPSMRTLAGKLPRMSNCSLKKLRIRLQFLLSLVEDEMDERMGKGGGGLK